MLRSLPRAARRQPPRVGIAVLLAALGGHGCAAAANDADVDLGGPADAGGGDAAPSKDGGPGAGDRDGRGASGGPGPALCPETDIGSPKLPNTVVVDDDLLGADATWTADKIYVVTRDLGVKGHKLTVAPGTTICLTGEGRIVVGEGAEPGEIHLDGTADRPIVITAMPSASDRARPDAYHRGLQLDAYLGSTLSHVNLWYGGAGGSRGTFAFELTSTARGAPDAKAPLLVDHLTVGAVQTRGLKIATDFGVADGSAIRFTGYDEPFSTSPAPDHAFEIALPAIASAAKAIDVSGARIPDRARHVYTYTSRTDGKIGADDGEVHDVDVVDFGLPYQYTRLHVLQIEGPPGAAAGATLRFHEGVTWRHRGVIIVGATSGMAQGNLVVQGTADRPVVFTSAAVEPKNGDWEGLYFVSDHLDPRRTRIDHAEVLYAGLEDADPPSVPHHVTRCGASFNGALMISPKLGDYEGPTLSNLLVAHSAAYGIVSAASAATPGPAIQMKTRYEAAALNIKIEDTARSALGANGVCR